MFNYFSEYSFSIVVVFSLISFNIKNSCGNKVQFLFYNRSLINVPVYLEIFNQTVTFNNSLETKILIHGYNTSCSDVFVPLLKNALLLMHNYNIICVEWSAVPKDSAVNAVQEIPIVAKRLAKFLFHQLDISPGKIHMIGHSFGCNIAAKAACRLYKNHWGQIQRVTALDPVSFRTTWQRKIRECVQIFDVVHTATMVIGEDKPFGHFDFYLNGGSYQPGCGTVDVSCSHARAYQYFAESILNPKAFPANRCLDKQSAVKGTCFQGSDLYMGNSESYNFSKMGIYYVCTTEGPIFSPLPLKNILDSSLEAEYFQISISNLLKLLIIILNFVLEYFNVL